MKKTMWIFTQIEVGESVVFDNYKKAKKFLKQYSDWLFEKYGEFPQRGKDYLLEEAVKNPDFEEWWEGEEEEEEEEEAE